MTTPAPERILVGPAAARSTVWLGRGSLLSAESLLASKSGRFLLFSSPAAKVAAEPLREVLGRRLLLDRFVEDREAEKTLETAARIADAALEVGIRRDDALVAVGGGVVTDVVGFAAAILLRGVTWNAVPTTTAGMADAAIGGKTGVNHPLGKNLLGAFHPPAVILIDPASVATLSDRDYRAGLIEAYKAAWIADAALAERAEREQAAILERDEEPLLALLAGAVRIKAAIVSEDPRDSGRRLLLNFGHTLGHALEAAGGFQTLRHGEAVAWGIAAALEISHRRAGLPETQVVRLRSTLARLGPFPTPERDPARLRPLLARDKKRTAGGLASIVLERIGSARIDRTISEENWLEAAAIMRLS
ncbi:MAG TPA: 3-dehydroquinate synthase family protein [Thermoanaerobaculia bacterium]